MWPSNLDSRYTERLKDRFSTYNIGEENRAVSVFLDNKRLRDGRNFVDDFARALVNSLIVVPVVTSDALHRMKQHDPYQPDHALMEWLMAIECFHSPASKVARVLPVLFGTRDGNSDVIANLFAEGLIEALPEVHPKETVRTAMQLLQANGIEPRMGLSTYTVRSILVELKAILGYCAWNAEDPSFVVAESAERVIGSLQEVLEEAPKVVSTAAASNKLMKQGPQADSGLLPLDNPNLHRDGVASSQTFGAPITPLVASPNKPTIKEVVSEIKVQLGLGAEVTMAQTLQEALDFLGDEALTEACKSLTGFAKAEKILKALQ